MTYQQLNEKLVGKCAQKRKLGNNTYAERRSEDIAIRLHSTDVLTFHPDGSVTLDSGGYLTATTKQRMNEYLPDGWKVSQYKGQWYIGNYRIHLTPTGWNWKLCLFEDGITLRPDGTFTGGRPIEQVKSNLKERKQAQQYAKRFIEAMRQGQVGVPSAGDCFYCQMRVVEPHKDSGKPLGEVTSCGHIKSHIEEGYFVPSLLYRALEAGPASIAMRSAVAEVWQGQADGWSKMDFVWNDIQKTLSRYLVRQLGQA